ncbi:ATP/maltotriose-dependent transcriptional regulator MalT [Amphibacillus cookii]|nr:ATP/maltotriose-dependent transcriptional regulator MalT [Amphibacillus cookii]
MELYTPMPELNGATKWINGKVTKKQLLTNKKLVLIHFWSLSSELSVDNLPIIDRLHQSFTDLMNIIAVHMPQTENDLDLTAVSELIKSYQLSYPVYLDHQHYLTTLFENQYVPSYYLFNLEGNLSHVQIGGGMKMLQKQVQTLINK